MENVNDEEMKIDDKPSEEEKKNEDNEKEEEKEDISIQPEENKAQKEDENPAEAKVEEEKEEKKEIEDFDPAIPRQEDNKIELEDENNKNEPNPTEQEIKMKDENEKDAPTIVEMEEEEKINENDNNNPNKPVDYENNKAQEEEKDNQIDINDINAQVMNPVDQEVININVHPPNWLGLLPNEYDQITEQINKISSLKEDEYNHFFNDSIILFIKKFLGINANYNLKNQVKIAYYYILKYIQIRSDYLLTMSPKEFHFMTKILNPSHSLFTFEVDSDFEKKICEEDLIDILKHEYNEYEPEKGNVVTNGNLLFKYAIEFALHAKFFEKLISYISNVNMLSKLENFATLIDEMNTMFSYIDYKIVIDKRFAEMLMKIIIEKYSNDFASLDAIKDAAKPQLEFILSSRIISDFTLTCYYREYSLNVLSNEEEKLLYDFFAKDICISLKCLELSILEKKLIGINSLNNICLQLTNMLNMQNHNSQMKFLVQFKAKTIINIFDLHNIYEIIFGANIHQAIISKSVFVLKFLYRNNKLNTNQIANMWKLAQEKHQSIRESIFGTMSELIALFSVEDANYIINLINEMQYKEISEYTLNLVESIANAINNEEQKKNIIRILFNYSREDNFDFGLDKRIIIKSRTIFAKVLLNEKYKNFLLKYLKKFAINIACHRYLNTSLCVLNLLFDGMKNMNEDTIREVFNVNDYDNMMKYIDDKFAIVNAVLNAFLDEKSEIIKIANELLSVNNCECEEENCEIVLNANNRNNLDITQSTEKSLESDDANDLDLSMNSSFSSGDSVKRKNWIVKNYKDDYKKKNFGKKNFDFFVKFAKLNFLDENYFTIIQNMFDFLKKIFTSTSEITLRKSQIEYLYKIFIENCINETEIDIFFNFFSEMLKHQHLSKQKSINEPELLYLFFDLFVKLDLKELPYSAYDFAKNFFFVINSTHNNLVISANSAKIIAINNFSLLVGFATLWKFYLSTSNAQISIDALNLLVNIISIAIEKKDNIEIVFAEVFNDINSAYSSRNEDLLIKLLNLLSIFICKLGNVREFGNDAKEFAINLKNNYASNDGPSYVVYTSPSESIAKLKDRIIDTVIYKNGAPSLKKKIHETGIILNWRGKILSDDCNVGDYDLENNANVILFKDDPQYKANAIDEKTIENCVSELKNIFEYDDEILRIAVKKNNGNLEEATIYLTNEDHIEMIKREIGSSHLILQKEISVVNNVNVFNEEKIKLLISLLDINNENIESEVWKLLSSIELPKNICECITEMKFDSLFKEENKNILLLNCKLANCVLYNDDSFAEKNKSLCINKKEFINAIITQNGLCEIVACVKRICECNEKSFMASLNLILKWIRNIFFSSVYAIKYVKDDINLKIVMDAIGGNEINFVDDEDIAKMFIIKFINEDFHLIIMQMFTAVNQGKQYNEYIYANLFEILLIYIEINPEAFAAVVKAEIEKGEILKILLENKSTYARVKAKHFFIESLRFYGDKIIKNNDDKHYKLRDVFSSHILKNSEAIFQQNKSFYPQYFDLFVNVLTNAKEQIQNVNFANIISSIISRIETNTENLLSGHIRALIILSTKYSDEVINLISKSNIISVIYSHLFSHDANLFKSEELRESSYNLLISLMHLSPIFKKEITSKIISHHYSFAPLCPEIANDIDIPLREGEAFIGLRNYGATCYLNSLIQQLYMMPSFKDALFTFANPPNDSVISTLQTTFANLSFSIRKFYPILPFIKSFKSAFNSQPISVSSQQDSDEFLAILCDEIEKEAKSMGNETILNSAFKGAICNEIVSLEKEYPYYSSTEENFIRITLDIKNHTNLIDAMDSFIKEEVLEGENKYFSEKHNRKIAISKRSSIKTLSDTVIIHLKRFEFDYNSFNNVKLNDYIEFPHEINFKRWTRAYISKTDMRFSDVVLDNIENANLDDSNMDYTLTGVLVHSGSSLLHGHYFSLIMDIKSGKWHRYDDTTISEFNVANLKSECFGDEIKDENANKAEFKKYQTAYLLFYTKNSIIAKVRKSDKSESYNEDDIRSRLKKSILQENEKFVMMKNYVANGCFKFIKEFVEYNVQTEKEFAKGESMSKEMRKEEMIYNLMKEMLRNNSENIVSEVNDINAMSIDDNTSLKLPDNICEVYNKCKDEITSRINEKETNKEKSENISAYKVMKFAIYYFFSVIAHQNDKLKIDSFANFLVNKINSMSFISIWLLKKIEHDINENFIKLIFLSRSVDLRNAYANILFASILTSYHYEKSVNLLNEKFSYFSAEKKQICDEYKSSSLRFISNVIIRNMNFMFTSWQTNSQFLFLLKEIIKSIPEAIEHANEISKLLFEYCNNTAKMGTQTQKFNPQQGIDVLCELFLNMPTYGTKRINLLSQYSTHEYGNVNVENLLKNVNFDQFINAIFTIAYPTSGMLLFMQNGSNDEPSSQIKILNHLCFVNKQVSLLILRSINAVIRENIKDVTKTCNLIYYLNGIFSLRDSIDRCDMFFEFDSDRESSMIFDFLFSFRDEIPYNTIICLFALSTLIIRYNNIRFYLMERRDRLTWIYYMINDIKHDNTKLSSLVIESSADGFSFVDVLNRCENVYINYIGINDSMSNQSYNHYEEDINFNDNTFNLLK